MGSRASVLPIDRGTPRVTARQGLPGEGAASAPLT